jgi:6,7-dimethyl-8-ribityllumazine synthase
MLNADKARAKIDGKKLSIGIVQARFNESIITSWQQRAGLQELIALGEEENITHVKVRRWKCHALQALAGLRRR